MITLELTEEEAYNLRVYLGVHHTASAYDTYPVYEKLADAMDEGLPLEEQARNVVRQYNQSLAIREGMKIDEQGLIFIRDRA